MSFDNFKVAFSIVNLTISWMLIFSILENLLWEVSINDNADNTFHTVVCKNAFAILFSWIDNKIKVFTMNF